MHNLKRFRAQRFTLVSFFVMLLSLGVQAAEAKDELATGFQNPPAGTKPWVYWFIMDGNLTREGITADFEAMHRAGIGGMIMMEVDAGIPRGKVDFMSAQWQELFAHAVQEAKRLGLQITLNAGPGWTGSGGPWVKPEQSMQHLVASATNVSGPNHFSAALPRPQRRPAFFGDGQLPAALEQAKNSFYVDEAVLAFPSPQGEERIPDIDEKALYVRAPYSSQPGVKPFLPTQADYAAALPGTAIQPGSIIDLTGKLGPDGTLSWDVPAGNWTILRFGRASTGANTRPAPVPALGLECDKFSTAALDAHFEAYVGPLLRRVGQPADRDGGGWTSLHIDSWEMGSQNWTSGFRESFRSRRGYDPMRFLPVMTGRIVGSRDISERFLWDLRQTAQEMVIENHAQHLKELGRRHGLGLSIEPYDMNPCADLSLGAVADVPMCEFWLYGFDSTYSVIEAASIAHTRGRPIVAAESFTSSDTERWQAYPDSMKTLGDWAFCSGVNRIVFHRYQHQPSLDRWPGMTMGPYGVHWERTQTWWDFAGAYHSYLARCHYLLRKGLPVADVCYLALEGAPLVFRPPPSAMRGSPPDHLGYSFDACAPETLLQMEVKDGRLHLPGGMSYRVLVLPDSPTMTPGLLRKVKNLAEAGATVIGPRPVKSPSLADYPNCDEEVRRLGESLWGNETAPSRIEKRVGRGRMIWESVQTEPAREPLSGARWIWYPEGNPASEAPLAKRFFRRSFNMDDPKDAASAELEITADNAFKSFVNGKPAAEGDNFTRVYSMPVTSLLVQGTNTLLVEASNLGDKPNPAGLIAKLTVRLSSGKKIAVVTDGAWEAALSATAGSATDARDGWLAARDLGPSNMQPWGDRIKASSERPQYGDFALVERTLLQMGVVPDFESGGKLRYTHRREGRDEIYFVANPGAETLSTVCKFRVESGRPELWDAVTGQIRDLPEFSRSSGRTLVPLSFEPHQSFFVIFRKQRTPGQSGARNFVAVKKLQEVTGTWEVSFDPRWGGPERITFDELKDWTQRPEDEIKFYSGKATYRRTLDLRQLPRRGTKVYLDLGAVRNIARVRLNGEDLGVVWCAPWRVDITKTAHEGSNTLEIEVANLWPNRLIRDSGLPAEQRLTSTTWNPFKPTTPLLESGLLGPVTIQIEASAETTKR